MDKEHGSYSEREKKPEYIYICTYTYISTDTQLDLLTGMANGRIAFKFQLEENPYKLCLQ